MTSSRTHPFIIDLGSHSMRMGIAGSTEPQLLYPNAAAVAIPSYKRLLDTQGGMIKKMYQDVEAFEDQRIKYLARNHMISDQNKVRRLVQQKRAENFKRQDYRWKKMTCSFPLDPMKKVDEGEVHPLLMLDKSDPSKPEYRVDSDLWACVGDAIWGVDTDDVPPLIISTPIPGQKALAEDIIEDAFENWMAPSVVVAPAQLFQAAGANTPSSIIVDVGHTHMTTCFCLDGFIHPSTVRTSFRSLETFDDYHRQTIIQKNGSNRLAPLASFYDESIVGINAQGLERITELQRQLDASHAKMKDECNPECRANPLPFYTPSAVAWGRLILTQIIRETMSSERFPDKNLDKYLLPDGTTLQVDGTLQKNISAFLCGHKALPSTFTSGEYLKGMGDQPGLRTLIKQTGESILSAHRLSSSTKKKSKGGDGKGGKDAYEGLPLPERITVSGGGSLSRGFDERFLSIFHDLEHTDPIYRRLRIAGSESINYSHASPQTASALWERVQRNPHCTESILAALRIPTGSNQSTPPECPVQIVAGKRCADRIFLTYKGASIVGSVGDVFKSVTTSINSYMEDGMERTIAQMPI